MLLFRLAEKIRAPRIHLRPKPHFDLLEALRKKGPFKALLIGQNYPFCENLREHIIQLNVTPEKHADVVSMGEYLPFPDESFDMVALSQVIEHTQYPFKVVEEAHRVLRPMGKLYISAPWVYPFHGGDNYRFSNEGLKLLCHQFGDHETGSLNGPLHSLAAILMTYFSESLCFGNRYIRYALGLLAGWLVLPLTILDAIFNRREKTRFILDANIFIVATKRVALSTPPHNTEQ
jgi:SAM-dependent methyltransferase